MHDPMTVAHEIKYPWPERWFHKNHRDKRDKFGWNYHNSFITIWHKDPETDGTDNSCDWFWRKFNKKQEAWLEDIVTNPDDNIRYYFPPDTSEYRMKHFVYIIAAHTRKGIMKRSWWDTPRWHFWHWRIQVHPLQAFKRRVFDRCASCGKRFKKGQPAVSGYKDGVIHHVGCYRSAMVKE